jgi:hypothetical protein
MEQSSRHPGGTGQTDGLRRIANIRQSCRHKEPAGEVEGRQRTGESRLTPESPILRAFPPCEVKTVRFQRLNVRRAAVRPTIAMPISLEWFRDSGVLADARAPRQAVGLSQV